MKQWRRLLWLGAVGSAVASFSLAIGNEPPGGTVTLMITSSSEAELIPCG